MQKFFTKFFPPSKTAQLVQEINTFRHMEGENLAEAWERFHELLRRCLHHKLTRWMQVHTFYNKLSDSTRTVIDASARGALMKKTHGILEDMAINSNQWPQDKLVVRKTVGGPDLDVLQLGYPSLFAY